jgi:uncharacterized spore protein YtfJ
MENGNRGDGLSDILPKVQTRIKAGDPLKIGDKTLFPIVKFSILRNEREILGGWAVPIAFLVAENDREYAISFTGKMMTVKEIIKMEPSLRSFMDKALGIHSVKVN